MRIRACLAAILLLGGCEEMSFKPYDYETLEDAKVKMKPFGCDVRIHGKRLKLEKTIKFPECP